ncbi:MAG: aldehyde dehydrogenase family protein [Sandaracinaceae bacterium]|nr:aldehyde dehydrogenase family protein [Sandaracinaceae bacterium]
MDVAPLIQDGFIGGLGPADAVPLDKVETTPLAEIPGLVERARTAQEKYAQLDLDDRVALLKKFANAVLARGEDITQILMRECGKVEVEARMVEVLPTADLLAFWSSEGPGLFATYEPELDALAYPGKRATVERIARGVVALITPWNFPVAIPLRTIFPALLAGNAIVMKPSEFTPRCARVIEECAREVYGPDLLVLAQGGGDIGAALIASGSMLLSLPAALRRVARSRTPRRKRSFPSRLSLAAKTPPLFSTTRISSARRKALSGPLSRTPGRIAPRSSVCTPRAGSQSNFATASLRSRRSSFLGVT